jgi:hypothetical protein
MARKPTDYVQFKLRIRQSLLKQIQKEAAKKKHSANNEAVERLEETFANEAKELRDSAIVDLLVDHNNVSGDLLRKFASELTKHPDRFGSETHIQADDTLYGKVMKGMDKAQMLGAAKHVAALVAGKDRPMGVRIREGISKPFPHDRPSIVADGIVKLPFDDKVEDDQ